MSFRRAVSALLLIAYLPACTGFQATTQPLSELTAPPKPVDKIRVTTSAGAQIEVDAPRVANDTLYGSTWAAGAGGKQAAAPVALSLADIRTVEVRRSDGGTTAILVVGAVAVIALLVVALGNTTEKELEGIFP